MIEFVNGDFFDFDADIRVNTVNCVGVMGAGVALAFKQKYPEMFKDYVKQCKKGLIRPGRPSVWETGDMFSKKLEIINFPTKDHWRKPSEYEYIESGLSWLAAYLDKKQNVTVTLPALGCGHGGLDWEQVKDLIQRHLGHTPNKILVFEPMSSKNAGKKSTSSAKNLDKHQIKTIQSLSPEYPQLLKLYTEKELYIFNGRTSYQKFDVTLVTSTKPTDEEKLVVSSLLTYCRKNGLNILLGSSAYEKKQAVELSAKGSDVAVFLPSGIVESAQKLYSRGNSEGFTLMSIGNPYVAFDRKAYMPAVLSRIFLSDTVIFTTTRFEWIKKHLKLINKADSKFSYVKYSSLSTEDEDAVELIGANPLIPDLGDDLWMANNL
ncbi:hypothetical protein AYY19_09925 [Photobacterium aquimaris]|uniref:macro domain-containing protein n=1 Tax=Photobacterium aquimaris TaxID=512643 RepID=UPI0007EFF9BC|nr:macro domain-containing protein [Photobacterium aquimaris]OBU10122.1 hypothetical protein AYY19_09925 [Photobacterium aquimaris]PSW00500.1 hypothetical protein CTM91_11395 [Photobacterium aquimaris]